MFECLAESRVRFITSRTRHLGDIHRAHAEFARGALQPHTADIAGGAFTGLGSENAVEVGDGESRYLCQHFTMKWFVDVRTDIKHHILDALGIFLNKLRVGQYGQNIVYQNACALLQMYHDGIKTGLRFIHSPVLLLT